MIKDNFAKIDNFQSKILPKSVIWIDVVVYAVVLLVCFLLFQQADLYHTMGSSFAYVNGHFQDFYDFNKVRFIRNDYLPILYSVFALWNLPLKMFGINYDAMVAEYLDLWPIPIIWDKLLLVAFFFATVIMVYKVAEVVSEGSKTRARLIAILFATTPIAIFAVFIMGQYDILGLFFTMIGFYYYVRKDFNRFAWFFSIAISFKFFALVIFIPLLLLAEKKLAQIAKFGVISLVVTMTQVAFYWESKAFRDGILVLVTGKADQAAGLGSSLYNPAFYMMAMYAVICLYAFVKKGENDYEWRKMAVYISLAAYGTMFGAVVWHPQWLIILTPFFALTYLYVKDKRILYIVDIIGAISFVLLVVSIWPNNVDVTMLKWGAFKGLFESIPLINIDLTSKYLIPVFKAILYTYLFSPLLVLLFQRVSNRHRIVDGLETQYIRARFFIIVVVFVIPSLFCALVPMSIALNINPNADLTLLKAGLALDKSQKPIGEIFGDRVVTQSFRAEHNGLCVVSIMFATYARENDIPVKLTLLDDKGVEITSQISEGKKIRDNVFYSFRFPAIVGSKGKKFQVSITSPDGKAGNAITAWMSESDVYPEGSLTVNGAAMPGDLMIKLYYKK